MINDIKFNLKMIHEFEKRYPQMPLEILVDIIDVVLNRASDIYFNYGQVQEHPEFCRKCGKCCQSLNCKYFNGKTCNEYESRYDACKEYPSYDLINEIGLILDPDCHFAISLSKMILDEEFQKNLELLSLDQTKRKGE